MEEELFDLPKEWEKHWVNMPEFIQEKQKEFAKIIFRFENEKDLNEFSSIIGQKLTPKTKSSWYPYKSHWERDRK